MSILNRGQITKSPLAADPNEFDNTDGSKKVMVTVYVDGRYTGADGSRPSDRIQLQTWIVPTTDYAKTPIAYLHKGDAAAFEYELRSLEYADKEGVMHYEQVCFITDVELLDTIATVNARLEGARGLCLDGLSAWAGWAPHCRVAARQGVSGTTHLPRGSRRQGPVR